jgi:hypothetical protein
MDTHGLIYGGTPNFNDEREAIKRVFRDRGIPFSAT